MFDVDQAKQVLQQRVAELDAEIASRKGEIEQGMLVERELAVATQQREEAARRLADHDEAGEAPAEG